MSRLIVNVCVVDEVKTHPDAERLALAVIKGWTVCIGKHPDTGTQFKPGDLCVYFPPDTVVSEELADRLNVKKYLQPLSEGGFRIKVARLRGQQSYGMIAGLTVLPPGTWKAGDDVAEVLSVTKYDPPQPCTDGDAERPHPAFHKYTGIENYRNFPDAIKDGEDVVFTEKLHGKNTRLGYIRDQGEDGEFQMTFMAGSHDVRRKEYATFHRTVRDPITREPVLDPLTGEVQKRTETRRCQFWDCFGPEDSPEGVRKLLQHVSRENGDANVVLFGEMIGQGVQDMTYGVRFGFRAFDLAVNGQYLDYDTKMELFREFKVEAVPVLYRGPFSRAKVEEFVDGPTTMCPAEQAGVFKGREGIVITPTKERRDMNLGGDGRVILKAVSFNYLDRKGDTTEYH